MWQQPHLHRPLTRHVVRGDHRPQGVRQLLLHKAPAVGGGTKAVQAVQRQRRAARRARGAPLQRQPLFVVQVDAADWKEVGVGARQLPLAALDALQARGRRRAAGGAVSRGGCCCKRKQLLNS